MNQDQIDKLIMEFIGNTISENDFLLLKDWLKKNDNKEYFDSFLKINYLLNIDIPFNHKASLEEIKSKIYLKAKNKKSRLYFKYGMAASILLLIFSGIWFTKLGENDTEQINVPIIVDNQIEPGTDRATLTLEDGSVIVLEKKGTFQTKNAMSNGEEIVYKASKQNITEVAYNYLTVPRGGEYFVKLPDGTQVWLNSESQLKYPVNFIEGKARRVDLVYGEAYFVVSPSTNHKGAKFMVFNQSQEVEVFGTEFNIKAYKDESNIYTTLVEGKVEVSSLGIKQNLIPNQQSILDIKTNEVKIITEVDVNSETSWRNGIFSFKGKPLKDIMKVISRWYDVDVVFMNKELESVEFLGVIDKHQSIERVLSIMKSVSINNYKIYNKTLILE